jgi:DivIVA domain-containing protein
MSTSQQPTAALESLRTVEFRQTLRGYHIDDVDEYLERVAVEAEALQEQLRQSAERMRQATDRIAQLESQRAQAPAGEAPAEPDEGADVDALQRTLALAQRFVQQTEAEAKADARRLLEDAQQRARDLVAEAEERARKIAEESERRLRDEVTRLESERATLSADVEAITKHLEGERVRLRSALGEMLHWIEEKFEAAPPPKAAGAGGSGAPGSPADARPERPSLASALQPVGSSNAPNGLPH